MLSAHGARRALTGLGTDPGSGRGGWTGSATRRTDRVYRSLLRLGRVLLHLCSRRTQVGNGHIPRSGPVLVAGNHLSMADAVVLVIAVGRCGRRIRMMSTAGVFRVPVLGPLLHHVGYVPVYRRSADPAAALGPARLALEAGECVGLYPEGAITRLPGRWPARAKTGVVRLALDTGAPVVPLAQWGTADLVGDRQRWRALLSPLTRPRVNVRIGAPLDLRALLGVTSADAATPQQLRSGADAVMDAIVAELVLLRGEPAPCGAGRQPNPTP